MIKGFCKVTCYTKFVTRVTYNNHPQGTDTGHVGPNIQGEDHKGPLWENKWKMGKHDGYNKIHDMKLDK